MFPDTPIKVLVVGSGGREHALCWKLSLSPRVSRIFCAPGNGGTVALAKTENVAIAAGDFPALSEFARRNQVELVVVGPDNPLAEGIVDVLEADGLRVFGPTRAQARLEWSKAYAKDIMKQTGLPTAQFVTCQSLAAAEDAIRNNPWARVVKVDGLAFGKGVFVCDSEDEAISVAGEIFEEKKFGAAGDCVVLEERLHGQELSLLAFCDGKRLVLLPPAKDHKARFDGDRGPNTGGMGAYSPVALYEQYGDEIASKVLAPIESALQDGRLSYKGILYIGLLVGRPDGSDSASCPFILEFNARFGDPETQALLPRLQSDLLPVLWACTEQALDQVEVSWSDTASCCVVAVTESYPWSSSSGEPVQIGTLPPDVFVFHAGTKLAGGELQTAGGRIVCVSALASTVEKAAEKAYAGLKQISFAGIAYRNDIAREAVKRCLSS